MFGYVMINQPELKVREFDEYRSWYCGLCHELKANYGRKGQATLSYDMTFLAMLLQGVYEGRETRTKGRCLTHPMTVHPMTIGKYTDYAADMNVLLAYYNLLDDWHDEKKVRSGAAAKMLAGDVRRIEEKYPRQSKAVKETIADLTAMEDSGEKNIDKVAGTMGKLLGEVYVYEKDIFSDHLYRMGFFLGKFIYLMDAYEDLEKDVEKDRYNPFRYRLAEGATAPDKALDDEICGYLNMMMAEAASAFEKLPIEENVEILRNIIYSGVWVKQADIYNKRWKPSEEPDRFK